MKDIMGLIYTGERDSQLRELTTMRAVAALPVLGRYRMIDFMVSSLVGSGVKNLGVIMQKNYHSLMDHLGSGKEWDLHGKNQGLVILPPFLTKDNVGVYAGFLDALRSNLSFLRRSRERYIVVTDSHMLYSERFDDMVAAHIKSGADVTMMYSRERGIRRNGSGRYMDVAPDGRVTQMETDPMLPHYENTFMEVFCLRREMLIDLVDRAVSRGQYHFIRDLVIGALQDGSLNIHGYECKSKVWNIDSVQAYFSCSMELLDPQKRKSLFSSDRPVWTKLRDEMPAQYLGDSRVQNSLVADGCIIEGSIENCVLFRGVRVHAGAQLKNCIVMQDGRIFRNSRLENCILDKQATIRENTRLIGPATYPIVIAKDSTV